MTNNPLIVKESHTSSNWILCLSLYLKSVLCVISCMLQKENSEDQILYSVSDGWNMTPGYKSLHGFAPISVTYHLCAHLHWSDFILLFCFLEQTHCCWCQITVLCSFCQWGKTFNLCLSDFPFNIFLSFVPIIHLSFVLPSTSGILVPAMCP